MATETGAQAAPHIAGWATRSEILRFIVMSWTTRHISVVGAQIDRRRAFDRQEGT